MRGSRRGYILLQALIVLAGLLSLVAILAADERQSLDATQTQLDARRADQAANAAVQRAMCVLASANTSIVTLSDDWALQGTNGSDEFTLPNSDATYRMQIVDAGSMLNVNAIGGGTMTPTLPTPAGGWAQGPLAQLPLQQDQIDSLLDWISTTTTATSDGAKDDFYNNLTLPYNTKLGPLTTVNELLLVDNWTAQTLYQAQSQTVSNSTTTAPIPTDTNGDALPLAAMLTVDSGGPNTQADGTARESLSSALSAAGIRAMGGGGPGRRGASLPSSVTSATSFGALFSAISSSQVGQELNSTSEAALLNTVSFMSSTTGGAGAGATSTTAAAGATTASTTGTTGTSSTSRITGRININTASQAVLETVPNVTTTIASSIVTQQSSGFQTLGELATDQLGFTNAAELGQAADYFTIGSDTWIVRAYGHCGKVGTAIEAVIRVTNGQPQVINWERINTTGIPSWWDWTIQSASTIDAADSE